MLDRQLLASQTLPFAVNRSIVARQSACVAVQDHPYMAVTDANGRFEMNHVPTGDWTFQFWHRELGYIQRVERAGTVEEWRRGRIQVHIEDDSADLGSVKMTKRSSGRQTPLLRLMNSCCWLMHAANVTGHFTASWLSSTIEGVAHVIPR